MSRIVHGIRFKTVMLMLAITLIPTLIITVWLYKSSTDTMAQEIQYNQMMSLESMSKYIEGLLYDVDVIASNLLMDNELYKQIVTPQEEQTAYQNYLNSTGIKNALDQLKNVNENIDSIYLYDKINERIFSTDFYGYINVKTSQEERTLQIIQFMESDNQWNVIEESWKGKTLLSNRKHQIRKSTDSYSFLINLEQKNVNALMENLKGNPDAAYCITDRDGKEIASTRNTPDPIAWEKLPEEDGMFQMTMHEQEYYAVLKTLSSVEWKFVSLVPASVVSGKLNGIRQTMYVIYVLTVFLIMLFAVYMNRLIYEPIKKLIATMVLNKEGTLATCEVEKQKDEFGEIAKNFNELIQTQDALNRKLRTQELLMKNAEIRFLQAQINPHFLYNVLDTIHWMAGMGKDKEVMEMTYALSRFYRSSLSHGEDMTCVKEAVQLAQAYFDIQKIRFHNRIELIWEIEEQLEQIIVPKRIFQPILENSINHGLAQKKETGIILIAGVEVGEDVKFIIEDNGIGLSEEKTRQINREIEEGDFQVPGNYALKNLNSQLKLLYGEAYGLKLESTPGQGMTVTIVISRRRLLKGGTAECIS